MKSFRLIDLRECAKLPFSQFNSLLPDYFSIAQFVKIAVHYSYVSLTFCKNEK